MFPSHSLEVKLTCWENIYLISPSSYLELPTENSPIMISFNEENPMVGIRVDKD